MKETFHITIGSILNSINYTKNDYFESNKFNKKLIVIAMIILTYLINILPPILTYESIEDLYMYILPPIAIVLLYKFLSSKTKVVYIGKYLISKSLIYFLLQLFLAAFLGIIALFSVLGKDSIYSTNFAIGMLCIFGMILCFNHLPKRTKYGNELYGRLVGFKNFLETTQKDKLNELLNDNPSYFKEIIPFAYVLNISNKWIKQFADVIDIESETYANLITDDISSFSSEVNEKTS